MIISYRHNPNVFTEETIDLDQYLTRADNMTAIHILDSIDKISEVTDATSWIVLTDKLPQLKDNLTYIKIKVHNRHYFLIFYAFYSLTKIVYPEYELTNQSQLSNLCRYIMQTTFIENNLYEIIDRLLIRVDIPEELLEMIGFDRYPEDNDEAKFLIDNLDGKLVINYKTKKVEKILAIIRLNGEVLYVSASERYRYDEDEHKNVSFIPYLKAPIINPTSDIEFLAIREHNSNGWENVSLSAMKCSATVDQVMDRIETGFVFKGVSSEESFDSACIASDVLYKDQFRDIWIKTFKPEYYLDAENNAMQIAKSYLTTTIVPMPVK